MWLYFSSIPAKNRAVIRNTSPYVEDLCLSFGYIAMTIELRRNMHELVGEGGEKVEKWEKGWYYIKFLRMSCTLCINTIMKENKLRKHAKLRVITWLHSLCVCLWGLRHTYGTSLLSKLPPSQIALPDRLPSYALFISTSRMTTNREYLFTE